MNIEIPQNLNGDLIMRRSGYGFLRDKQYGTESYVRRLGSGFYPRFHVYLEGGLIKLHLDQKQASYEGTSAHSGEYDGEVVENEVARIQNIMASLELTEGQPDPEEKKGFWQKMF